MEKAMINRLEKQLTVPMSLCDNTSHMSITGIFNTFMDLACEHGEILNTGTKTMHENGMFWVATKTKIKINTRPHNMQHITAATWPQAPSKIRINRLYSICAGEQLLAEGKTEWVVLDANTNKPVRLDSFYPVDLQPCPDIVCEESFGRMGADFSDCEEAAVHTVTSADIDLSQHMNNVAYIRAALAVFSCKELENMNICEVDAAYRMQCYEGEKLSLRLRKQPDMCDIGILKPDGSTACIVRIVYKK